MKLSEIKAILTKVDLLKFELPDGTLVPSHFHVTEIGKVSKQFIDCGGTKRSEEVINFQLWNANDYDHRIHPDKLLHIIGLSEKALMLPDLEIEVEYQGKTIEKFGLDYNGTNFLLTVKNTDCLAKDACNIPADAVTAPLEKVSCSPDSGCC